MIHSLVGPLPYHRYVFVDSRFTHREPAGFLPAVWFGLVSYPARMWGCTVLLESGAIYRNLPPHALAFSQTPQCPWTEQDAQTWECYGRDFTCVEYPYLAGLSVKAKANRKEYEGQYLFTVAPSGDGFSAEPEQSKEFSFIALENGRLTIQPTNHLIIREKSFTTNDAMEFPQDLKRQTEVYQCE